MKTIKKYDNIESELPLLPNVLLETIQSEFLEIQKLDRECVKFNSVSTKMPELLDATYVVFSKFIKKEEHKYEKFIFVNDQGKIIASMSGQDMELYGLLEPQCGLKLSEEYEHAVTEH